MASIAKIALVKASKENNLQEVSLLLSQKTDPNGATGHGISPLLVACTNGNVEIVRELIKAKAKIGVKKKNGQTTLLCAAASGSVETVQCILEAKADLTHTDNQNWSAYSFACHNGYNNILSLLVKAKLPSLKNLNSLLRLAAQVDQANCCQYLLDLKANPNDQDLDNFTASMYAIENRCNIKTLRTLLNAKAHIGVDNFDIARLSCPIRSVKHAKKPRIRRKNFYKLLLTARKETIETRSERLREFMQRTKISIATGGSGGGISGESLIRSGGEDRSSSSSSSSSSNSTTTNTTTIEKDKMKNPLQQQQCKEEEEESKPGEGSKEQQIKLAVILKSITKPCNCMNIIRSADYFGASEVVIVGRDTLTAVKTLWGSHPISVPIIRIESTLKKAITRLKAAGYKVFGIEIEESSQPVSSLPFAHTHHTAFLAGAEWGLSKDAMSFCDGFVYISQFGAGVPCINVGMASSIALHYFAEWRNENEKTRKIKGY